MGNPSPSRHFWRDDRIHHPQRCTCGLLCSSSLWVRALPFTRNNLLLAQEAVETINQFRAIGVPDSSSDLTVPPGPVPGLRRKLNTELKGLFVDGLNDQSRRTVPNEKETLAQLRAAGWQEISNNKWNTNGEMVAVRFEWQTDPGLLLITTQLWFPDGGTPDDSESGADTFQGRARRWQLVLETEADLDAPNMGEERGLQDRLSPPIPGGYLLVAQMLVTLANPFFFNLLRCPPIEYISGSAND